MRRRYRVAMRPKMRTQRARRRAAVVMVLALGALAFVTARRVTVDFSLAGSRARFFPAATAVTGAPESLKGPIEDFLRQNPQARMPEALLERFPFLASARLRRDFFSRAARYVVALRPAIAAVEKAGRPSGYLSDEGVVFTAPAGLYDVTSPVVDARGAQDDDLKSLAAFLPLAEKPDELLSPLARMTFLSAQDGWQAQLGDGTVLLWGSLTFTPQKFARLREVILDARARDGEEKVRSMEADLRYFDDGKILLRPLVAGGLR